MLDLVKGFLNAVNPFWKDGFFIKREVFYAVAANGFVYDQVADDFDVAMHFYDIRRSDGASTFFVEGLGSAISLVQTLRSKGVENLEARPEVVEKFSLALYLLPLFVTLAVFTLVETLLGKPIFSKLEYYAYGALFNQFVITVVLNFIYWLFRVDSRRYTLEFFKGVDVASAVVRIDENCGVKTTRLEHKRVGLPVATIRENLINRTREINLHTHEVLSFKELERVNKDTVAKEMGL